tara:strand:+ start:168 stop:1574 length:1407 start_codon:yes stop_codon:yes gene_type:complete
MALTITQAPYYLTTPVGIEQIFTVSDLTTAGTYYNVRYTAEVHVSNALIDPTTSTDLIGTFKTVPNTIGVGIFDFRSVLESFVSADNVAHEGSQFIGVDALADTVNPIHLIDKWSMNNNVYRYFRIVFKIEGSTTSTGTISTVNTVTSAQFNIFGGYVKNTDPLSFYSAVANNDSFGYVMDQFQSEVSPLGRILTNAPMIQYATLKDYGTTAYWVDTFNTGMEGIDELRIKFYQEDGTYLSQQLVYQQDSWGGWTTWTEVTKKQFLYVGTYPANLRNWSSTFNTAIGNDLAYYTVQAFEGGDAVGEILRINILCDSKKGYEPIRLTWLNQFGVWDYYTFNMKSSKAISTKGSTYQQLEGTWNSSGYKINGYKGGKKSFRVNATEKITMNTDFVNESESEWFEELINSPEVYILKDWNTWDADTVSLNNYVTPVRLTTSSYTRKTRANDKLMQYTFEVEKSKTLRTQSV